MPSEREMLLDRLQSIEQRISNHGQEMRSSFAELGRKFELHEHDDRLIDLRVVKLEEERRYNNERRAEVEKSRDRRVTLIGALAGTLAMSIWTFLKAWFTSGKG